MTDSNWAIPGAGVFLRKPTAAQDLLRLPWEPRRLRL